MASGAARSRTVWRKRTVLTSGCLKNHLATEPHGFKPQDPGHGTTRKHTDLNPKTLATEPHGNTRKQWFNVCAVAVGFVRVIPWLRDFSIHDLRLTIHDRSVYFRVIPWPAFLQFACSSDRFWRLSRARRRRESRGRRRARPTYSSSWGRSCSAPGRISFHACCPPRSSRTQARRRSRRRNRECRAR